MHRAITSTILHRGLAVQSRNDYKSSVIHITHWACTTVVAAAAELDLWLSLCSRFRGKKLSRSSIANTFHRISVWRCESSASSCQDHTIWSNKGNLFSASASTGRLFERSNSILCLGEVARRWQIKLGLCIEPTATAKFLWFYYWLPALETISYFLSTSLQQIVLVPNFF